MDDYPIYEPPTLDIPKFTCLAKVDIPTMEKLIKKSKPTTCELDPLPSSLVKLHADLFAPVLCKITNISFDTGEFPWQWKHAIVKPLLKKPTLAHIKQNYRPVSNLSFLSKLVEKASLLSFQEHMDTYDLLPIYQSAYRSNHSTETLLIKVCNDILHNMEQQQLTPLIAIDLSAAFDTVNHQLLLNTMEKCFGVCDKANDWMRSYLSDRKFYVHINNCKSKEINVDFSVPQGSINGPVYFTCYSSTLRYCRGEDNELAGYADDHSLYTSYAAGDDTAERTTIAGLSTTLDQI